MLDIILKYIYIDIVLFEVLFILKYLLEILWLFLINLWSKYLLLWGRYSRYNNFLKKKIINVIKIFI